MDIPSRVIALAPWQMVQVHGWFNPVRYLSWEHIQDNPELTFRGLLGMGIPERDLYFLQQDVHQWISRKAVSFADVPYMTLWPLHPLHDLKGNLGHFIEQKYRAPLLKRLGITYDVLTGELGMTEEHMHLLRLSIDDWKLMGMKREDIEGLSKAACNRIFGWPQADLVHHWPL